MNFLEGVSFGVAGPAAWAGKSGLEILRDMIAGRLPAPTICKQLGFLLREAEAGFAAFEGQTSASVLNPMGNVHGGWALTLIDSATGCAAMSTLPAGAIYTTVETGANFTRPIMADTGLVRCEARIINQGRQIITAEAKVTDSAGKLLAHGTSTLMVLAAR